MKQRMGIITNATTIALALLLGTGVAYGQTAGKLDLNISNVTEVKMALS